MQVKIFRNSTGSVFEYDINEFIKDKTIISITFKTEVIYNKIVYIAFITYKED
nr:MAG TPA: Sporulation protein Cse60 [Ackermannviridae sp.]